MDPSFPIAGPISPGARQTIVPMADSNDLRTSSRSLEDIKEIDTILQEFGKWLQKARFEQAKKKMTENCADAGLPAAAKRLLAALVLKILPARGLAVEEPVKGVRYNVLRLRGPATTRIRKVNIIPIQVWGFDPMLDGEELKPKMIVHATKGAEIKVAEGSIVDFLIFDAKEDR